MFLILVFTIGLFVYLIFKLTFWKRQNLPNILLHSYRALLGQTYTEDNACVHKYGKIVGTYELLTPVLIIAEPKLIKDVLVNNFENFSERNSCGNARFAIKNSILLSRRTEWKNMQNVTKNIINTKNLLEMSKHFAKYGHELVDILNQVSSLEKYIDFRMFLSMFAMKAYISCCFGATLEHKIKANLMQNFQNYLDSEPSVMQRIALLSPKLGEILNIRSKNSMLLNNISKLVKVVYDNRKVDDCKNSIVFMLSDVNKEEQNEKLKLTEKQIIDNSIMFSIIGYQTSVTTVSHLIYNLAINQTIQQKLIREIDETFDANKNKIKTKDKNTDKDKESTEEEEKETIIDRINKMQYLDACIKESQRLCPPVSRLKRKTTKAKKFDNISVPKGSELIIPVYTVHRDPDNYSDPEQFKPNRFLPQNASKLIAGSYIPFGSGELSCPLIPIALLEIKLSICSILKNFRFAKCSQTKDLSYTERADVLPIISTTNVFVKIIKRTKDQSIL